MNFIVHFIYEIILPIDELIFFKMVKTTSYCQEMVGMEKLENPWSTQGLPSGNQSHDWKISPI